MLGLCSRRSANPPTSYLRKSYISIAAVITSWSDRSQADLAANLIGLTWRQAWSDGEAFDVVSAGPRAR